MSYPMQTVPEVAVATPVRRFPLNGVDVAPGDTIVGAAVLVERQDKQTRQNKPMATLTFRNASGGASMPVWSEQLGALTGLTDGMPVLLTAAWVTGRDGSAEWKFEGADPLPSDHPVVREAQPAAPVSLAALGARTAAVLAVLSDEARQLFDLLMNTPVSWPNEPHAPMKARFLEAPAAVSMHHATIRGLFFHSLQVVELALGLTETLRRHDAPDLDVDAVVLGAFWHDIGKLDELSWKGAFKYTARGAMSTHMGWGLCRVTEALTRAEATTNWRPTPRQLELISHILMIISSHHGQLSWGALVEPASREAWIVSTADQTSAKVQQMTDAAGTGTPLAEGWTRVGTGKYQRAQFISPTASHGVAAAPSADGVLRLVLPGQSAEVTDVA